MHCLRNIGVFLLALLPLFGAVRANAAFGGVSNLAISGGFTPGYTTDGTNGTLRWNPATTQHEVRVDGVWTNLSRGALSGSGSGFPLTNNADFGGFGATNISFIGSETNPGTEAFLMYDGTGYVHRYAAKSVTNILDLAAAIASTNKPHLYPMQLLKYTDGHVYYLTQEIDPAVLGTNSYPLPGTHPAHWVVFVEKGAMGATGPGGVDGVDGADGFGYGWITPSWSASRGYDSNTLVSYNGRAYLSLLPNTNVLPTSTNTWLLYVDKGDNGTIVGTNYLLRGAWDAGELYATNDIVEYGGNLVIIGPTNISVAGVAPTLNGDGVATNSGNWSLHLARGIRGATGPAGADGTYTSFTNVTQVVVVYSNAVFLNTPSTSNDVAKWQYESGTTNYFLWGPVSTAGGTVTNATSTNSWLTAEVSGADVVIGGTATPVFAESDAVALAQGYQTAAQVAGAITTNDAVDDTTFVNAGGETNPVNLAATPWVDVPTPSSASNSAAASVGWVLSVLPGGGSASNAISYVVSPDGTTNALVVVLDFGDAAVSNVLFTTNNLGHLIARPQFVEIPPSTQFVSRVGGVSSMMSGPLYMDVLFGSTYGLAIFGSNSSSSGKSIYIGAPTSSYVGTDSIQIGHGLTIQGGRSLIVGNSARGGHYSTVYGLSANGGGSTIGNFPVAGGWIGQGQVLGYNAAATNAGVAFGYTANGSQTNIAIGHFATANAGSWRTAIGHAVTNSTDNSTLVRGTLMSWGGSGVFWQATTTNSAGLPAIPTHVWRGIYDDTTNLYYVNITGGVTKITSN